MTIRQFLKRRYLKKMIRVGPVAMVVFVCSVALPPVRWRDTVFFTVNALQLAAIYRYVASTPCPVCGKPLGWFPLPARCPRCNVSFDAPMPAKPVN
jgi:hypothetical protein